MLGQWSHAAGFRFRLSIRATRLVAAQHRRKHSRLDECAARYACERALAAQTLRITNVGNGCAVLSRPRDNSIPCNSVLKCAAHSMPSNSAACRPAARTRRSGRTVGGLDVLVRHAGCALRAPAQVSCGCSGLPSSCSSEDAATAGAVGSVGRRDIQRQRFQPPQVRATRLELIAAEADTGGRQIGEALAAALAFGMAG